MARGKGRLTSHDSCRFKLPGEPGLLSTRQAAPRDRGQIAPHACLVPEIRAPDNGAKVSEEH